MYTKVFVLRKAFEKQNYLQIALSFVGKKYDLLIIDSLLIHKGRRRFNQLLSDIPELNPRILSMRLKELEGKGIISKSLVLGTPVKTEYHLTDKSDSLEKVINELKNWAKKL